VYNNGGKYPLSKLGTPVMGRLTFNTGKYYDIVTNQVLDLPSLILDTCLITIRQAKQIVYTQIQGRKGKVKEYIYFDDYEVNIEGMLTSNVNGVYPKDDLTSLIKILEASASISVTNEHLNAFNITNI